MTTERLRVLAMWMVAAVLAILALLSSRGATEPAQAASPAPVRRVVPVVLTQAADPAPAPDAARALDAALEALASGTTCAARAAAADRLRALGDPVALPALRRALGRDDLGCSAVATRRAIGELAVRRSAAAY